MDERHCIFEQSHCLASMREHRFLSFLAMFILPLATAGHCALAQEKSQADIRSSSCSRASALYTIRVQIDATRTFDDPVQRIAVLIRAADLLWPYQQERARSAFTEALDLARQNFNEKGDKPRREGHLIVGVPDQRYAVISTIAQRDSVWAHKLSQELLDEETKADTEKTTKDAEQDARTNEKLLGSALSLLSPDQDAALTFARASLRYPATMLLPMFLYKLSEVNRPAADGFYGEALNAYADAPMERFLYLSSYAFGNDHEAGEVPMTTTYTVPKNFSPTLALERLFVRTLLRRAQQITENPNPASVDWHLTDAQQTWLAFTRLELQIEKSLPEMIEAVRQARGSVFTILNQTDQQKVSGTVTERPLRSFDELVEEAERQSDPQRREGGLVTAVLWQGNSQTIERLVDVLAKLSDSSLRDKLLDWLYFDRSQQAIGEKKLDVAKTRAAKVTELDQRAYLYLKIAEESIKSTKNDAEARELLEEVLGAAAKAPDTQVKGRALLGVAYLYTKVDASRSIGVLSDAVKSINRIESPDFSNDDAGRRIEGPGFGAYATMRTPGFSPENGFREVGKYDFDGALYLAGNFANKRLRAMTTLALVEECLRSQTQQPRPVRPKEKAKP
jgi:hypothetical protein